MPTPTPLQRFGDLAGAGWREYVVENARRDIHSDRKHDRVRARALLLDLVAVNRDEGSPTETIPHTGKEH